MSSVKDFSEKERVEARISGKDSISPDGRVHAFGIASLDDGLCSVLFGEFEEVVRQGGSN